MKFVRKPWERLGISRSRFYEHFINTGRLRLVKPLGDKRPNSPSAVVEEELEAVQAEIIAEGERKAAKRDRKGRE